MKKKLLLLLLLAATFFTYAQNVGIGTTTPLARLHITDSSVLFSATGDIPVTPGLPPLQGEGRRMMWYPDKAAFRAGFVNSTHWDKDNTGVYSAAFGYNNTAFGFASAALGYNTTASGSYSTSIGNSTIASGDYSVATGSGTNAVGSFSAAVGVNTTASGYISTAMGNSTTAKSGFETVMGRWNTDYTPANTSNGWVSTDRLFTIGNGTSSSSRSDALVILKNGNVGIGTTTPQTKLHIISAGNEVARLDAGNPFLSLYTNGVYKGYFWKSPNSIEIGSASGSNLPVTLAPDGYQRMFVTPAGNVGIGTSAPAAMLEVNSYTKLGSDAPAIKMIKLTGTTAATQGGQSAGIPHGLNTSRILSVSVLVTITSILQYPPNTPGSNVNFNWLEYLGSIYVTNVSGDSGSILSKPIKILITYEE